MAKKLKGEAAKSEAAKSEAVVDTAPAWMPTNDELDEACASSEIIVDFEQLHPSDALMIIRKLQSAQKRVDADYDELAAHVQGRPEVPTTLAWIDKVMMRLRDMRSVLATSACVLIAVLALSGCCGSRALSGDALAGVPASGTQRSQAACMEGHCR